MKKITLMVFTAFLLSFSFAYSLSVPKLTGRVVDVAGVLTSNQRQIIEKELRACEEKSSSQVAVLIIPSLQGENLEDYSMRVVEKWKLGQKEFDNGVLLLIAINDRKLRIEVGYGLEPILTDAKCDYIIRNEIVPYFRQGDFYQGILNGVKTITGIVNREFDITPEQLAKYKKKKRTKTRHIPIGFLIFIFIIISSIFRGGGRGGRGGGSGLLWYLLLSSGGGGRSGGSSFGGGFGGFSGGGGSFGGGGSSGGW